MKSSDNALTLSSNVYLFHLELRMFTREYFITKTQVNNELINIINNSFRRHHIISIYLRERRRERLLRLLTSVNNLLSSCRGDCYGQNLQFFGS